MFQTGPNRYKAGKNETHHFFGYWPKDSHLANYIRLEMERAKYGMEDPILQRLWQANCHGHAFHEIVEAIEQKIPPIEGVAIKALWNPSPKVTPFLLAETWRDRAEAHLEVNNDLRYVNIFKKEDVATSIKALLNNSQDEDIVLKSYPSVPVIGRNGNELSIHAF